jgi:hypothetical protein
MCWEKNWGVKLLTITAACSNAKMTLIGLFWEEIEIDMLYVDLHLVCPVSCFICFNIWLLKHKENLSEILRWSNECILKCYLQKLKWKFQQLSNTVFI